jgi:hypothetical protein
MKITRKVAAGAVLTFALAGSASAWAGVAAHPDQAPQPNRPSSTVSPMDFPGTQTESKFVPIPTCRAADTRAVGGVIKAGQTRSFTFRKTCKILPAAVAVQASITSITATGNGYLKAGPAGSTPSATVLNYTKTFNAETGAGLTLTDNPGDMNLPDVSVQAAGANTQLAIDVTGYYIKPIFVYADGNGNTFRASRAGEFKVATGHYHVSADRDVTNCVVATNPGELGRLVTAQAGVQGEPNNTVDVYTTNSSGVPADSRYSVVVTC